MANLDITAGLAFLAGLASFLSPCVLSLVPVYVGYLSGKAVGDKSNSQNRWLTFTHGLAFVLGFSLVFIVFNILAAVVGGLLFDVDMAGKNRGINRHHFRFTHDRCIPNPFSGI